MFLGNVWDPWNYEDSSSICPCGNDNVDDMILQLGDNVPCPIAVTSECVKVSDEHNWAPYFEA